MPGLLAKIGIGVAAAATATTAIAVVTAPASTQQAVVTNVVDGDTFDVSVDGGTQRIRLIDIDTPETKDPARPVECLGPEATAFLTGLLPVGTPVRLEFDAKRTDQYGRTVAAAFAPDGRMVNAEVTRAGLAQVVIYGDKNRFHPPIEEAWRDAAANRRGLHSPDVVCTVPAQAQDLAEQVSATPGSEAVPGDQSSAAIFAAAALMGQAEGAAKSLLYRAENNTIGLIWWALTQDEQDAVLRLLRDAGSRAATESAAIQAKGTAAQQREADAARAAAQAEADRIAREQAAAAEAEQQRAAAAQAAEERRAAQAEAAEQRRFAQQAPETGSSGSASKPRTGQTGHPCLPGERDGDGDGYCGERR